MNVLFAVLLWMASLAPGRSHIELATAITRVVLEERPLYVGDASRLRTAAYLVAVAFRESSFRNDAIGDHGRALCTFQLWDTKRDVLSDPELCTRIALERMRESMRACGPDNALGIYAAGPKGCTSAQAKRISRDRLAIARRLVAVTP